MKTQAGHLNIHDAIKEALVRRWNMWADDPDTDAEPLAKGIAEDEGVVEYDTRLTANLRHFIAERRAAKWTGGPWMTSEDGYLAALEELEAELP